MMWMTKPVIASPARKPRMPPALRSSRSNSVSGCRSSVMCGCRLQHGSSHGVIEREQRPPFQVIEEEGKPQAAHGHRNNDVEPVHEELLVQVGLNEPEQVREAHNDDQNRHPYQSSDVTLALAREQQDERDGEVE